jgi:mono/diheme cytochrome c family protein
MPSWGQEFGGPLRSDQVLDVSRFVMNWQSSALDEENPPLVLQDFILPGLPAAETGGDAEPAEGSAGEIVDLLAALPEGDASNGATLYTNLGCVGCHLNGAIAPITEGTSERVQQRLAAVPELEGYSPEQYLLESILMPNAYIVVDSPSYVDGNGNSLMPGTYRDLVDDQGLADLLAYLLTH